MLLSKTERRLNRKRILDALRDETGSSGGDAAEGRVRAYCRDPLGASTREFGYVGGLALSRFYIDRTKPTANERQSLWTAIMRRFDPPRTAPLRGRWSGETDVMTLQQIIEEE